MENKEKYKDILEEEFECICEECSKPFFSSDENATLCIDCWIKILEDIADQNGLTLEKDNENV